MCVCKGGDPEDGVMCYDKAMDQFFTSTGHERFVDCRKLNQVEGKSEAIKELLKGLKPRKWNLLLVKPLSVNASRA